MDPRPAAQDLVAMVGGTQLWRNEAMQERLELPGRHGNIIYCDALSIYHSLSR